MLRYPLFCSLQGKTCLVVGGGSVALHKSQTLLQAGAHVVVIACDFHSDFKQLEKEASIVCIEAAFDDALWPEDCWLALATTRSQAVNQQVLALANKHCCFCNVTDAPETASFISPATMEIPPIQIALTCGGHPVYSQLLKEQLKQAIPVDAPAKLQAAARLRSRVSALEVPRDVKRRFWTEFFADSTLERILALHDGDLLTGYLEHLLEGISAEYR